MKSLILLPNTEIANNHSLLPVSIENQFQVVENEQENNVFLLSVQTMVFVVPHQLFRDTQEHSKDFADIKNRITNEAYLFGLIDQKKQIEATIGGEVVSKDFLTKGSTVDLQSATEKAAHRHLMDNVFPQKYDGLWMRRLDAGLVPIGYAINRNHVQKIFVLAIPDIVNLSFFQTGEEQRISLLQLQTNFKYVNTEKKDLMQALFFYPSTSYATHIFSSLSVL